MSMSSRAVLLVRGTPDENQTIPIEGGTTTIGRSPSNDIVVDEDGVSRRHAAIQGDAEGFFIVDLDSRNGTFVNETKVSAQPHRLRNWDHIQLDGLTLYWIFQEEQGTINVPRVTRRP